MSAVKNLGQCLQGRSSQSPWRTEEVKTL